MAATQKGGVVGSCQKAMAIAAPMNGAVEK
jgi:hypothetical protein